MPENYCTQMQQGLIPGIGSVSPRTVLNSSAVYRFARDENLVDLDELRARLRKMNDAELLAFGKAAKNMCSPRANFGKPPRQPFVIQLQEARAEWRRHRFGL
jgi:hypothetical protein